MDGLEIISVRIADMGSVNDMIKASRNILKTTEPTAEYEIYRRIGSWTDLSVHIHVKPCLPNQEKSSLGLRLAQELKKYGIINHTLWFDQKEALLCKAFSENQ